MKHGCNLFSHVTICNNNKIQASHSLYLCTWCGVLCQVSPTPSQESLVSQHSGQSGEDPGCLDPQDDGIAPFMPKPFCVYTGHSADMLDISWSKVCMYYILFYFSCML